MLAVRLALLALLLVLAAQRPALACGGCDQASTQLTYQIQVGVGVFLLIVATWRLFERRWDPPLEARAAPELALAPRSTGARCAWCHAEAPTQSCPGCHTRLHVDCAALVMRCPTLGCTGRAPVVTATPEPSLSPELSWRHTVLVQVVGVALPLGLLLFDGAPPDLTVSILSVTVVVASIAIQLGLLREPPVDRARLSMCLSIAAYGLLFVGLPLVIWGIPLLLFDPLTAVVILTPTATGLVYADLARRWSPRRRPTPTGGALRGSAPSGRGPGACKPASS